MLGDFGISRVLSPDTVLARTSVGTPYYMSPESIAGMGYDGRADVWSMGVILFELLALRRPFPANNIGQLALAISTQSPSELPEGAPKDAAALVELCLRKDPETRPTARQLLDSSPLVSWADGAAPMPVEEVATGAPLSASAIPGALSFDKTVRYPAMMQSMRAQLAQMRQAMQQDGQESGKETGKEVGKESQEPPMAMNAGQLIMQPLPDMGLSRPHDVVIGDGDDDGLVHMGDDSPFVRFRPTPFVL